MTLIRRGGPDTLEDIEQLKRNWQQYRESLEAVRNRMPRSAFEFATAQALVISEPSHGDRNEIRFASPLREIEFSRGSRWIIECEDIEWTYTPQQ